MYSVQKLKEKFEKNTGNECNLSFGKLQKDNVFIDLTNTPRYLERRVSIDPQFYRYKDDTKERTTDMKSTASTPRSPRPHKSYAENLVEDAFTEPVRKFSRSRVYANQHINFFQNNDLALRSNFVKERLKFIYNNDSVEIRKQNKGAEIYPSIALEKLNRLSYVKNSAGFDTGLPTEAKEINSMGINGSHINYSVNLGFNTKNPLYYKPDESQIHNKTETYTGKNFNNDKLFLTPIISNIGKPMRSKYMNYDVKNKELSNENRLMYLPSEYETNLKPVEDKSDESQVELSKPFKTKAERIYGDKFSKIFKSRTIRYLYEDLYSKQVENQKNKETLDHVQFLHNKPDLLLDVDSHFYYRSVKLKLEAATRTSEVLLRQKKEIDAQLLAAERERIDLQTILKRAILRKYCGTKDITLTRPHGALGALTRPHGALANRYK
ncbi:uncharacterized protein LOC100210159 [Hydra vulgaris]|uniref:Uncharacterized protein LOC100210159 n=1 Tax=Hydra vulgaris TaxID=6087 RepID=A0ABM4CIF5_HYDVU